MNRIANPEHKSRRLVLVSPLTPCLFVTLEGHKILIATGSSPIRQPEFPFHDERVRDSNQILELKTLPKRLAVIGAGVIGSEYACTFAAIGTEVHLIDGRHELLPYLDKEVSAALGKAMSDGGVIFRWGERVIECDVTRADAVLLTLSSGAHLEVDALLVAGGRKSNTEKLNLSASGLKPGERGLLSVDLNYRTEVPHIYAVGDVIGPPALASTSIKKTTHASEQTTARRRRTALQDSPIKK